MAFVQEIRDVIAEPRYDTVSIPMAGSTLLTFFAVPLGQGTTSFGTGAKHPGDTNMELAGQLPNPYTFTVLGFRLMFPWNIIVGDLQVAINGAVFTLVIGAKTFLRVPARTIPAGNGPFMGGGITASGTSAVLTNGWPSMQNGFSIGKKPLVLSPTENFQITLTWPGGVQTLSAAVPATIFIDGLLRRGAQ